MRLPLIDPATLSAEQRPVYDDMRTGIEKNFQGFKAIAENGACWGRGIPGCMNRNSASRFGT